VSNHSKIPRGLRARLLADAGIQKVFDLCKEAKPGHDWQKKGNRIRGRCIFEGHSDTKASMDIVFDDGRVFQKCLGCGRYEGDGIRIIGMITGQHSPMVILNDIISQRFGVKLPEELADAVEEEEHYLSIKGQILAAGQAALSAGIANSGGEYAYIQNAVQFLRKRGIDLSMAHMYGLGVFPTLKHFADFADVNALPDVHEYLGPRVFDTKPLAVGLYGGWLMFPYYTSPTTVGRLKLRNPLDKEQETWLGRNIKETRGFFGLHLSAMHVGGTATQSTTAYVVEGEFDQLSLAQAQLQSNANDHYIVIGASGAGASDVDILGDSGINHVIAIGDNDAGGISFVKNILRGASNKAVRELSVYEWDPSLKGKDPDEVVVQGEYQKFWDEIVSSRRVRDLDLWCADQVIKDVDLLDAPRSIQKIDAVNDYGQLIADEVVRDLFVKRCATRLNLDTAILAKHVVRNDTEKGFRLNLERCFAEYLEPVAALTYERILLYSKTDKDIFEISLKNVRVIEQAMQSHVFHMKAFEFVDAKVGIPDWIAVSAGKKGPQVTAEKVQVKEVTDHFDWAIQNFVSSAPPVDRFRVITQGIHWADASKDPEDKDMLAKNADEKRVLVLNGRTMLQGRQGDDQTDYEVLESPLNGHYLMWGSRGTHWSEAIWDPSVLEKPAPMNEQDAYAMLVDMLDIGWLFKNHDLTVQYLAANMMTISVGSVFDYLPYTFFTAPTQSGKSTLLKGMYGGEDPSGIGVIEHAKVYDDYTAAGIMQAASGSSLLHCLDEWEDPDSHKQTNKSRAVQGLLEMTRNLSAGVTRTRGSQNGKSTSTYLRFPIVAAGIVPHQHAVDLNRWFTLEMDNTTGRGAPEMAIMAKYSQEDITRLRHSLTILGMQSAFKLKQIEANLTKRIFYDGEINPLTSTRYAKAALSTMAAMDWVGEDAIDFGARFIASSEAYIANSEVSEERRLFRAVFETNAIRLDQGVVLQSAMSILADQTVRDQLSAADAGLYHVSGTHVVMIYCQKLPAILKYSAQYKATSNAHQIFSLLKRNKEVHHDPTFLLSHPEIMQQLRMYITHPRPDEFLYINLADLTFSDPDLTVPVIQSETV
jgi:DNA primase